MATYVTTHLPHDQDPEPPIAEDPDGDAAALQGHRDIWMTMTEDGRAASYKDSLLILPPVETSTGGAGPMLWDSVTKVNDLVFEKDTDDVQGPASPQCRAATFLFLVAKAQNNEAEKMKQAPWYKKVVNRVWLKEHMPDAAEQQPDGIDIQNGAKKEGGNQNRSVPLTQDEARNIGHRELHDVTTAAPRPDTVSYAQYNVYLQDFNKIDADGDGLLDRSEIQSLIQAQLGKRPTARQLTAVMKQIDIDENGTISFDEYLDWVLGKGWSVLPMTVADIASGMAKQVPRHVTPPAWYTNVPAPKSPQTLFRKTGTAVINLTFSLTKK